MRYEIEKRFILDEVEIRLIYDLMHNLSIDDFKEKGYSPEEIKEYSKLICIIGNKLGG